MVFKLLTRRVRSDEFNKGPDSPLVKIFQRGPKKQQEVFLPKALVYDSSGEKCLLSDLWKDKTVILKVLPRLGCKFCKYDAASFSELGLLLDPDKVIIVAVCFTDPDLATFLADGYWSWSIYIDPEREVYKQANLYKVSKWKMFYDLMERRIWTMSKFLSEKFSYSNSLQGDPYQLGGTFIIAPGGQVKYQFKPTKLAMYPSLKEIYKILGGDPDDITELTPISHVYTQEEMSKLYNRRTSTSIRTLKSFRSSPDLLAFQTQSH